MNMVESLRAERLIAERYEELGYAVTLEPPRSAVPFLTDNYIPDILAVKGEEKLLIEVKRSGTRIDPEFYFRFDQEVQNHPGWRFLLVTVSDAELQEYATGISRNGRIELIQENLRNIDSLVDNPKMSQLVLPSLWIAYVSALYLLLSDQTVELADYTDLSLLNKAYSESVISIDEYQAARGLMKLRNQAVHSFDAPATPSHCKQLQQMVNTILAQLYAKQESARSAETKCTGSATTQ